MLPTTVTINCGTPAADVVFTKSEDQRTGDVLYIAPSPQGDLKGRITIRVANTVPSSSGLARTLRQVKVPVYNSTTGEYTGFIQDAQTVIRSDATALTEVEYAMEIGNKFDAAYRTELASAEGNIG
jgi:hypothetical protein